ncbi:tail fiber domain-containing protein [Ewingella americana]|uniref:tail fiber domain-containing protein n=1 Tax=Ewingella americana TaxID=41202 RepID=UPI00163A62E2|nr:tail fiber domain-containing protein [Ewingella americana]QMV50968.1 hypothetical protein GXP68_06070 [Ewingella americana]
MAWYREGTVRVINGSATVTGTGTLWGDNKQGIGPGQMLLVPAAGTVQVYEILRVDSNTQLTLKDNFVGATAGSSVYAIPSFYTDSVPDFARRLSAQLSYYQSQMDGWQQIMTGTGSITLTTPNGQTVTISSFKKLTDDMESKANTNDVLLKTGSTAAGYMRFNGGAEISLAGGFSFRGRYQGGLGRNNDIEILSTDASAQSGDFVGAHLYKWFSDGWLTGIQRGAGTNTLAYTIYYNGASNGGVSKTWVFGVDGSAAGSGPWVNGSDERHKSKIKEVENPLSAVCSWRGCSYEMKDGGEAVGLIAQDVEKFCPVAIKTYGDREFSDKTVIKDFKYLDTTGVSAAYHTGAIKQLFALLELALEDPDACRARIKAVKAAIIEGTQSEETS